MNPTERTKNIEKVKAILQTINMLLEKLRLSEDENITILIQDIEDIIKEQKLFENIDMASISSFEKNYITIKEFKKSEIFYDILYEMFLNKINEFILKKEKKIIEIELFKTFNQAYFYKKFIKYMSLFLDKNKESINDDIIKEKIFEIVHSLQSSEKIYLQDFYFYISMFTVHYYYPKNNFSFPEFDKIKDTSFNDKKMSSFLSQLKEEKLSVIFNIDFNLKNINSKNKLIEILSTIKKEIKENNIFNNDIYDNFDWNEIITKTEKELFKYLKENDSDNDLIQLNEHLNKDNNKRKVF